MTKTTKPTPAKAESVALKTGAVGEAAPETTTPPPRTNTEPIVLDIRTLDQAQALQVADADAELLPHKHADGSIKAFKNADRQTMKVVLVAAGAAAQVA